MCRSPRSRSGRDLPRTSKATLPQSVCQQGIKAGMDKAMIEIPNMKFDILYVSLTTSVTLSLKITCPLVGRLDAIAHTIAQSTDQ